MTVLSSILQFGHFHKWMTFFAGYFYNYLVIQIKQISVLKLDKLDF